TVSNPALAAVWAIPEPISPQPNTPTFLISISSDLLSLVTQLSVCACTPVRNRPVWVTSAIRRSTHSNHYDFSPLFSTIDCTLYATPKTRAPIHPPVPAYSCQPWARLQESLEVLSLATAELLVVPLIRQPSGPAKALRPNPSRQYQCCWSSCPSPRPQRLPARHSWPWRIEGRPGFVTPQVVALGSQILPARDRDNVA